MIFITGDVHGDFYGRFREGVFEKQKELTREDYVCVTGDFGIWNNSRVRQEALDWLENRNFTTIFVEDSG